jgi:hypothetical protein
VSCSPCWGSRINEDLSGYVWASAPVLSKPDGNPLMRRYTLELGEPRISYPTNAAKGHELAGVVVGNLAFAWTTREGELPVRRDEDVFVGKCSEELRHDAQLLKRKT